MVTLYLNSWEGTLRTSQPTIPDTVTVRNPQWNRNMDPALQYIDAPVRHETLSLADGPSLNAVREALNAVERISTETPWQPRAFTVTIGSTP